MGEFPHAERIDAGFVRKYDGAAQGRLRGLLNAAQVETCSEPLLRAGKEAARELGVPIHTHAGGNLVEFERIMAEHRRTPVQFLADIGFLDQLILSIAPVTLGAGRPLFPRQHDLKLVEYGRNGDFLMATYDVVGPRDREKAQNSS